VRWLSFIAASVWLLTRLTVGAGVEERGRECILYYMEKKIIQINGKKLKRMSDHAH
jgi:hypothetical protein